MRDIFGKLAAATSRDNLAEPISEDEAKGGGDGLLDEAHLTVFLTWLAVGGMEHPPGLTEIAEWPADLRHDVLWLLKEYGEAKAAQRRLDKGKGGKRK